jgi:hypothetical protein
MILSKEHILLSQIHKWNKLSHSLVSKNTCLHMLLRAFSIPKAFQQSMFSNHILHSNNHFSWEKTMTSIHEVNERNSCRCTVKNADE